MNDINRIEELEAEVKGLTERVWVLDQKLYSRNERLHDINAMVDHLVELVGNLKKLTDRGQGKSWSRKGLPGCTKQRASLMSVGLAASQGIKPQVCIEARPNSR